MSMLARYKKPGGFLQLLSLIESFGGQKREKFMEMINAEDPTWAQALQSKMLSIERLFKWPEQTITEIFRVLPAKNLACAMKGISKENAEKVLKYLSHAEKRKLEDEMGALEAKPEDIFAAFVRVIEVTRKMIKERDIHLEKIDPDLMIPENFEEQLAGKAALTSSSSHAHVAPAAEVVLDNQQLALKKKAEAGELDAKASAEIVNLHRTLQVVSKENAALKEEVKRLHDKLDQIRRIA